MGFRKRLIIAFMIMTFFPILLLVSVGYVILEYQSSAMRQAYETEVDSLQALQNPVQVLNRLTRSIFDDLKGFLSRTRIYLQMRHIYRKLTKGLGNDKPFWSYVRMV